MATEAVFAALRRRKSLLSGAFLPPPAGLSVLALVGAIAAVSGELLTSRLDLSLQFQRENARSLIRKVTVVFSFLESLLNSFSSAPFPSTAVLCFKELYIVLHRSKILLEYCTESSRLWLILQNPQISAHFRYLTHEISNVLDVFPWKELNFGVEVEEQMELLQTQCKRSKLYIDPREEELRLQIFSFLGEFEKGQVPDSVKLRAFAEGLGIRDSRACRDEIELLQELICCQEEDADPSVLGGVIALVRYCWFSLFGFQEKEGKTDERSDLVKKLKEEVIHQGIGESISVPWDFCCPISLDLMRDPVTVSSGQTYDRASITRWMEEGHRSCPKSGQMLSHSHLVPNRALQSLIAQWCAAHGVPYEPPEGSDSSAEGMEIAASSQAAVEANRVSAKILIRRLSDGLEGEKGLAARELRLLTKTGKENRALIAELGAIPLLHQLLCSRNAIAQENSVTAILNLSLLDRNKILVMEEEGCLRSIVDVLRHGWTVEARENAAATLFSLSAVHEYKKRIMEEPGAVEALVTMLRDGSPRGKQDSVSALFNTATHPECCRGMVESGVVPALVAALGTEGVAEDAAGTLALLVRHRFVAQVVVKEDMAVESLLGLMRWGSPRGKENAVAALSEICRSGGAALTQTVARTPALGGLLQTLLLTGTRRARKKAASLARMCQRCEESSYVSSGDVSIATSVTVL